MYSRSPMTSDGSQGSSHVSDFLGHRLADRAFLSADLLQANSADDLDKFRAPTSMVSKGNFFGVKNCLGINLFVFVTFIQQR
jgi:hypothetical protein